MNKFSVSDMTCDHRVSVVTKTVKNLDPSAEVSVDLAAKEVSVRSVASTSNIAQVLGKAGYAARLRM